jgi:beta-ribofuranosylaminobenzene 5'-phosphate synthase
MKGSLGRKYGTVGVSIETPHTVVEIQEYDGLLVEGSDGSVTEKTKKYAIQMAKFLEVDPNFRIVLKNLPPAHSGFGSGTQLALSVGTGIARLCDVDLQVEEVAWILKRGKVSGIGIYAFRYGGFIIDGGHKIGDESPPPLIFRQSLPSDWYFVIGIPELEEKISGVEEKKLMNQTAKFLDEDVVCRASRVVLMKLMPAAVEGDIVAFGQGMNLFEKEVGRMFSCTQGDVFRHQVIKAGVEFLMQHGAYGAGQSSWGPAFYGLVKGEQIASDLAKRLTKFLERKGGGNVLFTRINNTGAEIVVRTLSSP